MRQIPIPVMTAICILLLVSAAFGAERGERDDGKRQPTAVEQEQTDATSASPAAPQVQDPQVMPAGEGSRDGEEIKWQVLSGGGGMSAVGDLVLGSTVGQTAVGSSSIGDFSLNSGFWQDFGQGDCCVLRGDIDHSGGTVLDIVDLMWLVDYMFREGPAPYCHEEADVDANGDPIIDIDDLMYLVDYMFLTGPAPAPCP